jgi:hypothetical protein
MPLSLYRSSLCPMASRNLCIISQMGSSWSWPSSRCISLAEIPFLEKVIKAIVRYHFPNGSFEACMIVPLLRVVWYSHWLHCQLHLFFNQYCLVDLHFSQTTPSFSLCSLKCVLQACSLGNLSINLIKFILLYLPIS